MPIPTRFERWMRSKLSAMTNRTPSSAGPLAAQSRDEPEPYSRPARTASGDAFGGVAHRHVVDEPLVAVGQVDGVRPLLALDEPVAQPDVAEGAAHHDLVVTAPRTVRVELERPDAVRLEPLAGRRLQGAIEPAGEMWSVVTESPRTARTRASVMSPTAPGSNPRPSKNGGLAM